MKQNGATNGLLLNKKLIHFFKIVQKDHEKKQSNFTFLSKEKHQEKEKKRPFIFFRSEKQFVFRIVFLFFSLVSYAQTTVPEYLNLEQSRLTKVDSINVGINNYIQDNINTYSLTPQQIADIMDGINNNSEETLIPFSNSDLQDLFLQVKKEELRQMYFNSHPGCIPFFNATEIPNPLRIQCINGGFEDGSASYTINARQVTGGNTLPNCTATDNSIYSAPSVSNSILNQYFDTATLVDLGDEPFLAGLGIHIPKVHSGTRALKLNPTATTGNFGTGNVTKVFKDVTIDAATVEFSYLYLGHASISPTHPNPFFRCRILELDGSGNPTNTILRTQCVTLDPYDCRYSFINDTRFLNIANSTYPLVYTPDWVCQHINTADLIGRNVRIEFTVSDCTSKGHFSTAYIDDLCGVTCTPTWGAIQLNNINMNCPSAPFQVCGTYQLPTGGSINSIQLQVLNASNTVISTLTSPSITNQDFCFTVNPSILGSNPQGNYTLQAVATVSNNNSFSNCSTPIPNLTAMGQLTISSILPTFTPMGPYCQNATTGALPTTSNNLITGTWSPSVISTTTVGTQMYTFTPSAGQCASSTTMNVVINAPVVPTFTAMGPYCQNATPGILPLKSNNLINGTWSPATINTASGGTYTYTFTPSAGQCAKATTIKITIIANINPTFNAIPDVCINDTPPVLPTSSTNSPPITGIWNSLVSTTTVGTTFYIFTPSTGQCANPKSLSVTVNSYKTPLFASLPTSVCLNATPIVLPSITTNTPSISGIWSLNNVSTTTVSTTTVGSATYIFTPQNLLPGQCYNNRQITVVTNPLPVLGGATSVCMGSTATLSPATGGTWTSSDTTIATVSGAIVTPVASGTVTLSFTSTSTGCTNTKSFTVNSKVIPTFSFPTTFCKGATGPTLPLVFGGSWSPTTISTNNAGTYNYTFTPAANQCALPVTIPVTILPASTLVAVNDTYNYGYLQTATTTGSILANDLLNGSAITTQNVTVALTGTLPTFGNGGITLNTNGTFAIQPYTAPGTYTFTYQLSYLCATSVTATATITIAPPTIVQPGKYEYYPSFCFNQNAQTSANGLYDPASWGDTIGVLVNGLPASPQNIAIVPIGLASGLTLNANGTLTIVGGLIPNGYYAFNVMFYPKGTTTNGVGPMPVAVFVDSTILANDDQIIFDTGGSPIYGSTNVLDNDGYFSNCTNYQLPTIGTTGSVSLTQISPNSGGFSINAAGGVSALSYANTGSWTLTYQICDLTNPMICMTANVEISIVNTSKMPNNNPNINYSLENVLISPNPSEDVFTIDFGGFVKEVKLELFTLVGQKIYEQTVQNINEYTIAVDNLPKGTYLLKLSDRVKTIVKKLIKR